MKRIDRSSKGHYESETASRTATLGVHNLFEPYSNKLLLQQVAAQMTYQASWRHERIFRRPEREDRRSARARDGQEPSRPHLLRLALLRQTLRQTRRGGSLASPQEETRLKTQAR